MLKQMGKLFAREAVNFTITILIMNWLMDIFMMTEPHPDPHSKERVLLDKRSPRQKRKLIYETVEYYKKEGRQCKSCNSWIPLQTVCPFCNAVDETYNMDIIQQANDAFGPSYYWS